MPAAWILNAQIPRTLQYGLVECSCWESGCGEWDIFEILDPGDTRAKSSYHGGEDSNYFNRPTRSSMKAAVIFDADNDAGHIVVLPDDTDFTVALTADQVNGFVNQIAPGNSVAFRLGS